MQGYLHTQMAVCRTNGQYGLYTRQRMPDIPGLCRYECYGGYGKDDFIEEVRPSVDEKDFSGTIFTKEPIARIFEIAPDRFPGFTDESQDGLILLSLSPAEMISMTEEELEYFDETGGDRK